MRMAANRSAGFGSVVVIAVSMLLTLVLVMLYMRTFLPTGRRADRRVGLSRRRNDRRKNFEEQQKRHLEDMNRQLGE